MADTSSGPGLNDLMALFGGANPLAVIGKSITQLQSGVANFMHSVENFNETMEQMNGVARRINGMLDDIEPLVATAVPQLTRTLRAADDLVEQMSGPIERVAPGLMRLAETLSSPVLTTFPRDLSQFVEMFGDVARRMQPLGQLAETAGGFFGMNPLAALRNAASGSSSRPAPPVSTPMPAAQPEPPIVHVFDDEWDRDEESRPASRKKAAAKKSAGARKAPAKRSPAKTSGAAKKSGAGKASGAGKTSGGAKKSGPAKKRSSSGR